MVCRHVFDLNSSSLLASLLWGAVGLAFTVYGKKQSDWPALFGGLAIMAISYFIESAWMMSLVGAVLVAGTFWVRKRF